MQNSTSEQVTLSAFQTALNAGTFKKVRRMLSHMDGVDIARIIEATPYHTREVIWALIESPQDADVLQHLNDDIRTQFASKMKPEELAAYTASLDTDDLVDILQDLPQQLLEEVLRKMKSQDRHRIETAMSYPEDTAGGLMNIDTITLRPDVTLGVVLKYLQSRDSIPESTDRLFVVNRNDSYLGSVKLSQLLTVPSHHLVGDIMESEQRAILADTKASEIAQMFERQDLISAPVVDVNGQLLGRITIDDVVDIIRSEGDHSFLGLAGLDESQDTFAPIWQSAKKRAVWLGVNLITAIMASLVIGLFEESLDKMVALAILMPIVASMGGIAGSQTLTLTVRAMALGQVTSRNARWLLIKETAVGAINGVLWSLIVASVAWVWFGLPQLAAVIAIAMILNLIVAASSGALIPLALKRMRIDPAIAGSVVVTTVTDIVGFVIFLGLASWWLL